MFFVRKQHPEGFLAGATYSDVVEIRYGQAILTAVEVQVDTFSRAVLLPRLAILLSFR